MSWYKDLVSLFNSFLTILLCLNSFLIISIAIDGLSGTLKAGDVIKFANHTKVYMIVSDLTGPGTLSIQPGLRQATANDTAITYDNVPFLVRLNNDVQEYDLGLSSLVNYEVDFIEAI